MAYEIKYRSVFYNHFHKNVNVAIYKKDYVGGIIDIRTTEVSIESNYADDETPIIGRGAKVVIAADETNMVYLEDLLLSTEREFMCIILYDGTVVFRGFTICDINERQLLPYAAIIVQFTDYLHRVEGEYPKILSDIGGTTDLYSLINNLLEVTNLEFPLLVNSTLFEDTMNKGTSDTFLPQTYVQNCVFYNDSYSYDNVYDAMNKALKSFGGFIYSFGDRWILERQEDITREGNWVKYSEQITAGSINSAAILFDKNHSDFFKDNYQVDITHSGATITFTGNYNFGEVYINNTSGNLTGSVNPSQNYALGQSAIDRIYPGSGVGYLVIYRTIQTTLYLNSGEDTHTACMNYYDDNWLELSLAGVTLTYAEDSDGWYVQFVFDGDIYTEFDEEGALTGELVNIQSWIETLQHIRIVTLSGTTGTADITCCSQVKEVAIPTSTELIVAPATSLKETYNKQDGDFEYVDLSQIIEYDSGLHTLILSLRDKLLDTLVFNNWPAPDAILRTTHAFPDSADNLLYRNWYVHEDISAITVGEDTHGINQWVHYTNALGTGADFNPGWAYKFAVYANQDSEAADTILSVKFSMSADFSIADVFKVGLHFMLRIIGGPLDNAFLTFGGPIGLAGSGWGDPWGVIGTPALNLFDSNSMYYAQYAQCRTTQVVNIAGDNPPEKWDFSQDFNLEDFPVRRYNVSSTTYTQYTNLWALLGNPEYQMFEAIFLPPTYTLSKSSDPRTVSRYTHLFPEAYLGDIQVTVNAEKINNKITYVLNEDFVKTQEVDLYLFDLENLNYGNALLKTDGLLRTKTWISENNITPAPLYEVFAKCKFRKYGHTIHRLKGTILCDHRLKPFAILTDDTILNDNKVPITFLLNGYTWDLNRGTYDIEAEEYTEETVVVDGIEYDSEGNPVYSIPETPTALATHMSPIYPHPFLITWHPVGTGIQGYRLMRNPWWDDDEEAWVDEWKLIYDGTATRYFDFVIGANDMVNNPSYPKTIYWKVCAYNHLGESPFSSNEDTDWYP